MNQGRLRVVCLLLADIACAYAVWSFVVWAYWASGSGHYPVQLYYSLWPIPFAFVACNVLFRLYHGNPFYPAAQLPPPEELRRLVGSSLLTHLGLIALLVFTGHFERALRAHESHYSRFLIVAAGLLTAFLSQPFRNLVRRILNRYEGVRIPVALIAPASRRPFLKGLLDDDMYGGFRVAREFDETDRGIVAACREEGLAHAVIASDPRVFRTRLDEFTSGFSFIEFLPANSSLPIAGAQVTAFDGVGGLEMVNQRHLVALKVQKRALDLAMSVLAFLAFLPCFIVLPLLIRLTSKGPAFYRQTRLGKGGRTIRVWKFRSMYVDADVRLQRILETDPVRREEWEANFKLTNDPRVTPLGKFLRKSSLDELPQLFNVFAGEMALVGPRPIIEAEVAHYGASYPIFSSVLPGVTGLWQASGRSEVGYERRVALDVHYVLNWSPWMDLWILFRTVGAVLFMRGAR